MVGMTQGQDEEKLFGVERKEHILGTIDDLFADWLYYDRKEDYELPRESIEEAIKVGDVTKEEIQAEFNRLLEKYL